MSEISAGSETGTSAADSGSEYRKTECRRILVKTPFGRGCSESEDLFEKFCRESPFNSYFVLPTTALVHRVIRGMLSKGIAAANKSVCTPKMLAEEIVKQNHDYRLISDVEAKMILMRVIKSDRSFVESLSPTKEFTSGLLNDLYTLIYSICEQRSDYGAVLRSDSEHPSAKNRVLTAIIDRYLAIIEKDRLVSPELLYARAAEFIENGDANSNDNSHGNDSSNSKSIVDGKVNPMKDSFAILFGIYEPVPSLRGFLTAVSKAAAKTVYYIPYSENKRICSDDGSWFDPHETAELSPNPVCKRYELIFGDDSKENQGDEALLSASSENAVKVYAKCFPNAKSEISAIAEEIHSLIEKGVSPSEIAISFPDPQSNLALLDEIFGDFNLKYSAYVPLSLANSPIVQSLMLIPRVISENFSPRSVGELFASPYFRLKSRTADQYLIEKTAIAANIGNGFHSWENSVEWLLGQKEAKLGDEWLPEFKKNAIKKDIAEIRLISESVIPFLSELNALNKSARYSEHIQNYLDLLRRYNLPFLSNDCGPDLYRSDNSALEKFYKLVSDLYEISEQFFGEKISFQEFAGSLRASVAGCGAAEVHDSSAVQVLGMNGLQSNGYEYLFMAGLVDGKLPLLPKLIPYITENESKLLWSDKRREKIRWETFYFISALCSAKRGLYLTTRASAVKDTLPSPFYIAAVERLDAVEMPDRELIHSALRSQKNAGRDIAARMPLNNNPALNYVSSVSVANRINAEIMRTGGYKSAYDGILSDDKEICAVIADKFNDDYAFSPTSLEQYAGCPFAFLLKHIYNLDEPVQESLTLSSRDKGNLIHESLAELYTEWMKTHKTGINVSEKEEAFALLMKIAESKIAGYGKSGPAWDAMASQFLKDSKYSAGIFRRFIEQEAAYGACGPVPYGFEVGFGRNFGTETDDISAADPNESAVRVKSDDGDGLLISGFIDRVDVTDAGDFAVIDYKTGNHPGKNEILNGKALQLPLYIRAFEEISGNKLKGAGGCYYAVSRKKVQKEAVIYDGDKKGLFSISDSSKMRNMDLSEVLNNSVKAACGYRNSIRNGVFSPVNSVSDCKSYCIFSDVCRVSEFRLLEHKLNTGLYNKGGSDADGKTYAVTDASDCGSNCGGDE
ncbi:PD-(D/E)XK nuclease family protein [Methanomicrobium mobile]|uniref:PD-(D/E)XK nuclease family protein n=1 Tax=Methanomicrobium mobile TaxID=2205 RepID=UPI0005B2C4AC|nr:PD-(D/E)XK nuclease family protein [Methanomicrobium mobile]